MNKPKSKSSFWQTYVKIKDRLGHGTSLLYTQDHHNGNHPLVILADWDGLNGDNAQDVEDLIRKFRDDVYRILSQGR